MLCKNRYTTTALKKYFLVKIDEMNGQCFKKQLIFLRVRMLFCYQAIRCSQIMSGQSFHMKYTFFSFLLFLIFKGSLHSIPSPSSAKKIQIMDGKVCLRCKGKTLLQLGIVNKLLKTKSLLTSPSNSNKHSHQQFEFSLEVKVLGSKPGYLLKYFQL